MPIARFQMPDGKIGRFEVPDGTSPEQAQELINSYVASTPELAPKVEQPSEDSSDLVRGFTNYLPQLKETYGGAKVLAGKAAGSEELMKSGLATMEEAKHALRGKSKETDSFTNALDKGIGAVLTDWLPYQVGSGAANLLESLALMGAGAAAGSVVPGLGTAVGGITGLVGKKLAKEGVEAAAKKIAAEKGEELAKQYVEEQTKLAVKTVAKEVAGTAALGVQAGFHGAGETASRAVEEAERLGREATDIDLERVLPAAGVHAVAEFFGDKIGLGAFNKIDVGTKNLLLNFSKNLVTTGTKETPVEIIQSAAERFGAKMSLSDAEAVKEYVDAAAAAYGMSVGPAAGGAVQTVGQARMDEEQKRLAEAAAANEKMEQQRQAGIEAGETAEDTAAQVTQVGVPDANGNVTPMSDFIVPDYTAAIPGQQINTSATQQTGTPPAGPPSASALSNDVIEQAYFDNDVSTEKVRKSLEPQLVAIGLDTKDKQKEFLNAKRDELQIPAFTAGAKGSEAVRLKNAKNQWKANFPARQEAKKGLENVDQSSQSNIDPNQSGASSTEGELGGAATGAEASNLSGVDVTTGDAKRDTGAEEVQRPTLIKPGPAVWNLGGRNVPVEVLKVNEDTQQVEILQTDENGQLLRTVDANLISQEQKTEPTKLTDEQLAKLYAEDVAVAKSLGYDIPAWADLSAEDKEAALPELTDRAKTSGMLSAKEERKQRIPLHVYKLIKKQLDAQVASGEVNAKVQPEITEMYEGARKEWGADNEVKTTAWKELDPDEQAVYLNKIGSTTAPSIDEVHEALDALSDYREAKKRGTAPLGASFYEVNREAYNKDLPLWSELSPSEREAFLKPIQSSIVLNEKGNEVSREVTAEQMDAGFKAVVESVNKRLEEKATKETTQAKEQKGKAQRVAKEEETTAKEEVEVGRELPPLVKMMLGEGGVNNVLSYIAKKARGIMIGKKDSPRSEAIKNYEKRYGALSRAIFKNVAAALNTINFSSSKVVVDPNNTVIKQLQKEGKLAAYDPKTDTFYFTKDGMDEMTVLHEIVHAGTIKILYAYKTNPNSLTREQREAAEQINKVYEFAKKKLETKYPNQMENVYEFVSYALTEPRFQEELSRIQAPSLAKYTAPPKGAPSSFNMQSVWSHLTKAMMKLFGLTKAVSRFFEIRPELYDEVSKAFGGEKYTKQKLTIDKNAQKEVKNYIAQDGEVDTGAQLTFESISNLRDEVQSRLEDTYPEAFSNTTDQGVADFVDTYLNNKNFAEQVDKTAAEVYKQSKVGLSKQAGYQGNALLEVTQAFQGILAAPEAGIDIEALPAKAAPPAADQTVEKLKDDIKTGAPDNLKEKAASLLSSEGAERMTTLFQNNRAAIKRWQERLLQQGRIISFGLGFNNIYDQLTLSSGNAHFVYTQRVQNLTEDVRKGVVEFANKNNMTVDRALQSLGLYAIGRHVEERSNTLYTLEVPLEDSAPILKDTATGKTITPFQVRENIKKALNSRKLKEEDAKALWKLLTKIVNDPANLSRDPTKKALLDRDNPKYSVAAKYTKEQLAAIKEDYNRYKDTAEPVLKDIEKLNKVTLKLNKESNYLSEYADNWINFYGWENYIPLKGKSDDQDSPQYSLNYDSRKLSGELQESVHTFQGRISQPDNPVLQVLADSAQAAMRVGRKYVTESIYNAAKKDKLNPNGTGVLNAEVIKVIDFEERASSTVMEDIKGNTKIFHYMPDGKVAIIKINDNRLLEAIRRTYKDSNPYVDLLNKATSFVGQTHTRYNLAFAPVNFVRDVLTNAYTLGSELGPEATFNYLGAIASDVVQGKMFKTNKFSRLYSKGNVKEIEALAEKDAYYKDLLDYVRTGGRVSYIAGLANRGQYDELYKGLGGNKIVQTKEQVDKVFDAWIDTFELSARVSAYRIAKSSEIARLTKEKSPKTDEERKDIEKAASIRAAAYSKNLANFEQVGEWGKVLGAFFMFFRPSATGAVRAMEAIAPAFQSLPQARLRLPEFAHAARLREKLKGEMTADARKATEKELKEYEGYISKFESNFAERQKSARVMATALIGMGFAVYLMAKMMADDDDLGRNKVSTDDMSRWTKFARFFIPGFEKPLQLPWGFGLGGLAALGAQLGAIGDNNVKLRDTLGNIVTIGMDSFLPLPVSRINPFEKPREFFIDSMTPSIVRPLVEYSLNVDALGRQIYNNRQSRFGDAYTGGDNIPEAYKAAARKWFDLTGFDVSPNSLYFFANNYADGASRILIQAPVNLTMFLTGKKEFNWKTDTMVLDSFIGAPSNFDARTWQKIEDDLKDRAQRINMLKDKPDKYYSYLAKNPMDQILVDMYNHDVNGTLKDLREEANKYRAMEGLTPKERNSIVKLYVKMANIEKYRLVQMYSAFGVKP